MKAINNFNIFLQVCAHHWRKMAIYFWNFPLGFLSQWHRSMPSCLTPGPKNLSQKLGKVMKSCATWLVYNKLPLHLDKAEYIVFGSKRKLRGVMCSDHNIASQEKVKYLGLVMPSKSFLEVVLHICRNTSWNYMIITGVTLDQVCISIPS